MHSKKKTEKEKWFINQSTLRPTKWRSLFILSTFASRGLALLVSKDNTTTGFFGFASSVFLESLFVIMGELGQMKRRND